MLATQLFPDDYNLTEIIHEGIHSVVYRGASLESQQPVILKVLKSDDPSLEEIAYLKHEYKIEKDLNLPGVVKALGIASYKNRLGLVFEDFGGKSLKQLLNTTKLDLETFLDIAIQLAQALADLHSHHIIHKDIKPANIIINPETEVVKLADLSLASQLDRETPQLIQTQHLEGTLAYMSPEQTGRMNRTLDYRTDFYSLGVTFYEMLTGELPFQSNDPLELVYCHIAKVPIPIKQLNPEILSPIAAIVMKLMAKNAEDRYHSARGLKADLEFVQQHLTNAEELANFIPGERNRTPALLIPQKLYGRTQEVETLLAAFDRASLGKSEMMLVSGYSGIGKSSLVNEVHKPIVRQKGYFIAGKFDQFKRNIPYTSITQAFQFLMRQLLTQDPESLQGWRNKLQTALGNNGQVIVDVIPELELIIGKQPPVQKLELTEAQNRFHLVFQKFIRVFTQKEHPLVIFLDDLQWADVASLKLMQMLICNLESQYLLLIGAYRDNEVNLSHPLMQTVEEIQRTGTRVNHIVVKPLDLIYINQLLCDTLCQPETDQTKQLASLLFHKTAGNPFFLIQMLKTLQQEQLLVFDFNLQCWQWNFEQIQAIGITDLGVVELISRHLNKLPKSTQEILTYAACIGASFKLDVLAIATAKSILEVAENLWLALQQGLILPLTKDYKVPLLFDCNELQHFSFDESRLEYRFLHDRVQQAAYGLIPDEQKRLTHHRIGQLLLENTSKEELQDNIFDIINQLNLGIIDLNNQAQRNELLQLNLLAGRKAKDSSAYEPAAKYLRLAMDLLTEDSWQTQYDVTITLYKETAEMEFINGNFEKAEFLIFTAIQRAESHIEKADLYNIIVLQYTWQTRFYDAIQAGIEGLRLLGIELPKENFPAATDAEMEEIKQTLGNREISSIINLPVMEIEEKKVAYKLLINVEIGVSITSNIELKVIITLKAVNLSLKYGNIPESVKGYCNYGAILGNFFGDYKTGYEFGLYAYKLSEKFDDRAQKSKSCFMLGAILHSWSKHIKGAADINHEGYQVGLESGELQFVGYNLFSKVLNLFFQGVELSSLLPVALTSLQFAENIKHSLVTETILVMQFAINELMGNRLETSEINMTETEVLKQCERNQNLFSLCLYYVFKCQSLYTLNRPREALNYVLMSKKILSAISGFPTYSEYYFYTSLILADIFPTLDEIEVKSQYWKQLQENQKQMKRWVDNCPENFLHKYLLIEAEIGRITGNHLEAIDLYDRAIESAREWEFIQNEALANELAAKFWFGKNKPEFAKIYIKKAYQCYRKWGATAKVQELESSYPDLCIKKINSPSQDITITSQNSTSIRNTHYFDFSTILKVSQALSGEIILEHLLEKFMYLVCENAGAQKIFFIEKKDENLFIEASRTSEGNIKVCQSLPINECDTLSKFLTKYVSCTQAHLVLDDAISDPQFNFDPYIIHNQPQSILVLPILNKGNMMGILYLENNLIKGAFTQDRLEVLQVIASLVAISLENARFYQTLETRVTQRTQELKNALEELRRTQLQLIQNEKMSSLGQLVAGIAHEVNNPINFIYGNIAHISNYIESLLELIDISLETTSQPPPKFFEKAEEIDLEYVREDIPKVLNSIWNGAARIRDIVQSLRNFSRLDEATIKNVNLHEGIDNTLMILQQRLGSIQVIKEYGSLPKVECYAGEINQVFLNLLTNAINALLQGVGQKVSRTAHPTIWIRTEFRQENKQVAIRIADNGIGMTEDVKSKIFDPFFTNNAVGKGSGLGLSISHQIVVDKHGGQITCQSVLGEGTEFTIILPS
ncbi:AAA family ATPase [Scytonema sp. NUACC21]